MKKPTPNVGPDELAKIDRLTKILLTTHTFFGPQIIIIRVTRFTVRSGHPLVPKGNGKRAHSQWPANQASPWHTVPSTPFWCSTLGERWRGCGVRGNFNSANWTTLDSSQYTHLYVTHQHLKNQRRRCLGSKPLASGRGNRVWPFRAHESELTD